MKAAVYAGTRNVYQHMVPAMKSLLCNSDVDKVYFLIEDDKFPFDLPSEVECININSLSKWFEHSPNIKPYWSVMPLYRAAYAKIFPHLDRILSLDNDTIVHKNISHLWDLDMTNYYLAGVRDTAELNKNGLYINAGVLLHNLAKIREDQADEYAIDLLNTTQYQYPEQDVFNQLYEGHILELPSRYNAAAPFMNYDRNDRTIIHYVGDRRFYMYPLVHKYRLNPVVRPLTLNEN